MTSTASPPLNIEQGKRRLPIGAELLHDGGVHFRVWAPRRDRVQVVIEGNDTPVMLAREDEGYFTGIAETAGAGARYRFKLDDDKTLYPDPASRYQPEGVHGPSQVIDAAAFRWTDHEWPGVPPQGQVLYEMHIGTFTPQGTWTAAMEQLPALAELGITCLEVMPVAAFAGTFGWGYDGVLQFAPHHHYGTPDDFRRFVDRAHQLGLGVILDLVYNHLGPDGNYLPQFSDAYFSKEHLTDWGDALNFDGPHSRPVREYYLANARYWIEEFHLDGFRFDATQAIIDSSDLHMLAEITRVAREAAAGRSVYLINENEPQNTQLVQPAEAGGYGMTALWNDDFHHSARVAVTGQSEAYYSVFAGSPQELLSASKWGYLFQGQRHPRQEKRRGTPAMDLQPTAFVNYLQNHDQIANSGRGLRLHQLTSPGEYRAITALLLLMPQTPMLFQGQEFAASTPFHYFADHNPELAKLVRAGRAKELSQYPSVATPEMQAILPNPDDRATFERCILDHAERHQPAHAQVYRMHQDLLRLRRTEEVFRRVQRRGDIDGAVLGPAAFVLRYFGQNHDDRLLVINLGLNIAMLQSPEPLLAPPAGQRWFMQWTSEDPAYGGSGMPPLDTENEGWFIPGRAAAVLKPMSPDQAAVLTRIKSNPSTQAAQRKGDAPESR